MITIENKAFERLTKCQRARRERKRGLKRRNIEAKAAAGKIPSAPKLFGGREWTFDPALLRASIDDEVKREWARNDAAPRPAAIGAAMSSGAALRSGAKPGAGHLRQAIRRLRQSAAKKQGAAHRRRPRRRQARLRRSHGGMGDIGQGGMQSED